MVGKGYCWLIDVQALITYSYSNLPEVYKEHLNPIAQSSDYVIKLFLVYFRI
jgi:hypothetical protein